MRPLAATVRRLRELVAEYRDVATLCFTGVFVAVVLTAGFDAVWVKAVLGAAFGAALPACFVTMVPLAGGDDLPFTGADFDGVVGVAATPKLTSARVQ